MLALADVAGRFRFDGMVHIDAEEHGDNTVAMMETLADRHHSDHKRRPSVTVGPVRITPPVIVAP